MTTDTTANAEILTFSCYRCGDVLKTNALIDALQMCRCGATTLDKGIVRVDIGFDAGWED